jgi:hypothetical protein
MSIRQQKNSFFETFFTKFAKILLPPKKITAQTMVYHDKLLVQLETH